MSDTRIEINLYAAKDDKPILHWLLKKYHLQSEWKFVAKCLHEQYGPLSYQTNRIWSPTPEGRILYAHRAELEKLDE